MNIILYARLPLSLRFIANCENFRKFAIFFMVVRNICENEFSLSKITIVNHDQFVYAQSKSVLFNEFKLVQREFRENGHLLCVSDCGLSNSMHSINHQLQIFGRELCKPSRFWQKTFASTTAALHYRKLAQRLALKGNNYQTVRRV